MDLKEQLTSKLNAMLEFIGDKNSYYALFGHTVELCAVASEVNRLCFDQEIVSDEEFRGICGYIGRCRQKAIDTHREWLIKQLVNSKTKHTRESIIVSVFNDIYPKI